MRNTKKITKKSIILAVLISLIPISVIGAVVTLKWSGNQTLIDAGNIINNMGSKINEQGTTIEDLETKKESVEKELASAQQQVADLNQSNSNKDNTIGDLNNKILDLNNQIDSLNQQIDALNKRLQNNGNKQQLENELIKANQDASNLQLILDKYQKYNK